MVAVAGAAHMLLDRGLCFTANLFEWAYAARAVACRRTQTYTPRTNGMVERLNDAPSPRC